MRRLYWWKDGKWSDEPPSRGNIGISIHQDTMDPTQHPCDGRVYESKSAFRRVTREHGCVEKGNDRVERKEYDPRPEIRRDLVEQYRRARGY